MMLTPLLRRAETVSRCAVWFGGALAIASVLLISFDVIARKLFGVNVGGADELSSYAFAIGTSWSLAFVVLQRANVRVDVIYQYLPIRLSAVLDWLALVSIGLFMGVMTRYVYDMVETSWVNNSAANTPLGTPLWIPQGLWFLGLAWMCVTVALMLLRASFALVTGDIDSVKRIGGLRSVQQEAQEEAAAGERLLKEAA